MFQPGCLTFVLSLAFCSRADCGLVLLLISFEDEGYLAEGVSASWFRLPPFLIKNAPKVGAQNQLEQKAKRATPSSYFEDFGTFVVSAVYLGLQVCCNATTFNDLVRGFATNQADHCKRFSVCFCFVRMSANLKAFALPEIHTVRGALQWGPPIFVQSSFR